jgi:hypothetical protein
MRILFAVIFFFIALIASASTYYLAPGGSDNNPGTMSEPFFSLSKVWTTIVAGDTVYLRGGTYQFPSTQHLTGKNGTSANKIKIWAFPGEIPTITKATNFTYTQGCGVYFKGNYFHWKGIEITGFAQLDKNIFVGFKVEDANHNVFEKLNSHHNGHGMIMAGSSDDNLILNCDFHHNADPLTSSPYDNADGLEICYIPVGLKNKVKGCRFWWNSDDGIDLWLNESYVAIDSCWSWNNGYIPDTFVAAGNGVGFKLGKSENDFGNSVKTIVTNCLAYKNRSWGFHQNGAYAIIALYNNTSYMNGAQGFCFDDFNKQHIFKNNISYRNVSLCSLTSSSVLLNNTFLLSNNENPAFLVTDADFISLDGMQLERDRKEDGSLPDIDFLHLVPESDLVDSGADAGLPYYGTAPDIGAFELVGEEINVNKSPDINIFSPMKGELYVAPATITIEVNASDPDGTITKVELFNGTKKLGEVTAAPYSFTLKELQQGSYSLTAMATDNLNGTAISPVLDFKVTSSHENQDYFNLYPNPNDGHFSVDFTSSQLAENYTLTIYNLIGTEVYREELSKDNSVRQFDLSFLNPGTYLVIITSNEILLTQKFIKG